MEKEKNIEGCHTAGLLTESHNYMIGPEQHATVCMFHLASLVCKSSLNMI